ncbi:MAG: hypothetical protein ABWZ38_09065, partial [Candidatus Binatia bacterium]
AEEDLVAKAQNEREVVVYGTALAAQFDKFVEPFKQRFPFIKTQYSRTTGEALTSKILREVSARQLSADVVLINNYTHRIFMKRNIITNYRGVNLFPADWTLSDSYEEHNKTYREIFWKGR